MVLTAYSGDTFEVLRPNPESKPGDRVYLEGAELKKELPGPTSANKFKKIVDSLKTDDNTIACFNNVKLRTEKGFIKVSSLKNANIS